MTDLTMPEKLSLASADIAEEKRYQLKRSIAAAFPEIMAEDKIDLDQLRRVLGEWVEPDRERFGLNWPGKAACMKVIQAPSVGTLKPCREDSVNWDTTENVFIEGDNLEVLKLLQKAYFGKVKMIYIDPPYNTGKEFIYPDKFAETLDTYLEYTGQVDNDGRRFTTNTDSGGRFHSRWLNMMYPRLYIAKNLLKEDGAIFISIDENEISNLRILCDSIFGAENFVGTICWKNATDNNPTNVAIEHEYIVIYCRSRDKLSSEWKSDVSAAKNELMKIGEKFISQYADDGDLSSAYSEWFRQNKLFLGPLDRYKYIDRSGVYTGSQSVHNPGKEGYRYDVLHPVTGRPCQQPLMGYRFPEDTLRKMIDDGRILFGENECKIIEIKVYAKDYRAKLPSVIDFDGRIGAYDIRSIFQDTGKVFNNPKPVDLIKDLIGFATDPGDIILDFFGGSGTTAQAVLDLTNSGAARSFILVQLPEPLDTNKPEQKAAAKFCDVTGIPQNIAGLSRERIRRFAKKVAAERNGQLDLNPEPKSDLGFRAFKLDRSNFRLWNGAVADDAQLEAQLSLHIDHIAQESSPEDILYELLLKAGFKLSEPVRRIENLGQDVYGVAGNELILCLERNITPHLLDAIADYDPIMVVCLDSGFRGHDQLKANAVQTFKARARSRETAIEFRTV